MLNMEKKLSSLSGRRVDLFCSDSIVFRGRIEAVEDGIVRLVDDDERTFSIASDKVVAVSETADSAVRPGFRS